MLGALLIVLIRQSIRTLHFDQNYEWIIIGCAIIIAVVLDQASARFAAREAWRSRRAGASTGTSEYTATHSETILFDTANGEPMTKTTLSRRTIVTALFVHASRAARRAGAASEHALDRSRAGRRSAG